MTYRYQITSGFVLALLLFQAFGSFVGQAQAHFEADGLIVEQNGQLVAHVWQGGVTGNLLVPLGGPSDVFEVTFLDPDSVLFRPDTPGAYLRGLIDTPSAAAYDSVDTWAFRMIGLTGGGSGHILLRLWFADHYDFTSPPIPFSVVSPSDVVQEFESSELRWRIAPNPSVGSPTMSFELSRERSVRLTLHDGTGRLVRTLSNGRRSPGRQELALDTSGLVQGVYFVRLSLDGEVLERKIQVLR